MTNIEENELTLSQLFTILKKSALKILVYALSAIIFVTAALVTVRAFTDKRSYTVTLTLTEADASTNKLLNDRANGVLTSVLNDKYGASAREYLSALKANFTITPYVPDNLDSTTAATYIPTQYTLSLEENKDLKLSANAYQSILNAVADNYKTNFVPTLTANMFSSSIPYDYDIDTYLTYFDISEVADDLFSQAQTLSESLDASIEGVPESAKTYKCATKDANGNTVTKSVSELVADMSNVINRINRSRNHIADKKLGSLDYIEQELKRANIQVTVLQGVYESAKADLKHYAENKLGGSNATLDDNGNIILITGDETYFKMYNDVQDKQKSLAVAISYRDELTIRKEALEATSGTALPEDEIAALTANVKSELKTCHALMKLLTTQYKDVSTAYNNYKFGENYVSCTVATKTSENPLSVMVLVIIDLAVFIVAVIVACCQTNSKMKSRTSNSPKADDQPNAQ